MCIRDRLNQRLTNARDALEAGNASQAVGLADGIARSIKAEREAMDDTRRAIRQKKKLLKQFETRQDKAVWQSKWDEIIQAADSKQWSHAATLLERMTSELDKDCLLYTSPSPRDRTRSRMPSSA